MRRLVLFNRRSVRAWLAVLALLVVTTNAHAQGIGFQGGATIDPEQMFGGSWGQGYSLATINLEFIYRTQLGRSPWSMYQGGGPAIVLLRFEENTDVHAGSFFIFGFSHANGFFTEFRYGGGTYPQLKFGAGVTIRKKTP